MELTVSKRTGNLFYRLGITLAALLLVAVVGPRVALAHAHLESSTPADGATVASGLTQVTITFSEEVSVDQSNAQLAFADGGAVSGVTSAVDRANRNTMTITTPALADGRYTVTWRAVTEDDNGITNGTFSFTVGSAGAASGGETPNAGGTGTTNASGAPLPATGSGDATPLTLVGLVLAALLLGLGTRFRSSARA
ncbi:MAG: copper resistance protein CopC [Chloroflexota bacterium]|nr:copper resistance protein CopC [Chloroflexota bacterium]MDQ5867249.1 copper resistance protein CopC [Chloroflexota bacterium]